MTKKTRPRYSKTQRAKIMADARKNGVPAASTNSGVARSAIYTWLAKAKVERVEKRVKKAKVAARTTTSPTKAHAIALNFTSQDVARLVAENIKLKTALANLMMKQLDSEK